MLEHVLNAVIITGRDFLSITKGLKPVLSFTAIHIKMFSKTYAKINVSNIPITDTIVSSPVVITIEAIEQNIASGTISINILVALMNTAVSSPKTSRRTFAPATPTDIPIITAMTII